MNTADYAAEERLRNNLPLHIRALRPSDRAAMFASFQRMSEESRYRRFFAPKHGFSEREIEDFINVDFINHVALAAVVGEGDSEVIAGAGRYIVTEPNRAEIACAVDDAHQNLGIATHLIRHLLVIARHQEIVEVFAEVLPDNLAMLNVFRRCGSGMTARREDAVVHVSLDLSMGG
ncbi:MAG: GNAT family N-acetyltransferase [Stellaceae bacterium]